MGSFIRSFTRSALSSGYLGKSGHLHSLFFFTFMTFRYFWDNLLFFWHFVTNVTLVTFCYFWLLFWHFVTFETCYDFSNILLLFWFFVTFGIFRQIFTWNGALGLGIWNSDSCGVFGQSWPRRLFRWFAFNCFSRQVNNFRLKELYKRQKFFNPPPKIFDLIRNKFV